MATKLITLPLDDPAAAQALLTEWLDFDDKVLLIVLGDTKIAFETARLADIVTGGLEEEPRWVIHGPNREDILDLLNTIEDPDGWIVEWDKTLFAAVSITDIIRDMALRDGTQPNKTRLDNAFMRAEEDLSPIG